MPYKKFTTTRKGKKKWGIKNIKTGKVTLFSSPKKRKTGIRMREMFAHGFKPTKLKRTYTKVRKHPRRTKTGRTTVREHDRTVRKHVVVVTKGERKLFDEITKKDNNNELAMVKDFKNKKGKIHLAKYKIYFGHRDNIEFPLISSAEFVVHTHPKKDILTFSKDDMEGILSSKKQEAEVVFRDGKALLLRVPNKLNRKKFINEYGNMMNRLNKKRASDKEFIKESKKMFDKYGFKHKNFKKGQEIKTMLEVN